ncbi:MAG: S41 family peptidase [Flavisolibacter sp.]
MWKKIVLPVIFITAFLSSNGQAVSQAVLNKEQTGMVIHSLAAVLQENYVFPDTALSMVNLVVARFRQGVYDSLGRPGLLAAELSKDLWSVYHDGHLRVRYDPKLAVSIGKGNELSAADKRNALEYTRQLNFGFNKIEILDGNIGYLKINMFAEVNQESKQAVVAAFRFLQNVRALIIDLRENGGGDPEMVQYVCNYLFPKRTHLNDIYVRRNKTTNHFWTTPDQELTSLMKVPVYILTSKTTFSGAEEFAYDLQTQNRGVVVGEVTGGGAHPVEPRAISNGFVLFVPFARAINPITKTNWEGKGVQPNIETPADKALEAALEQIRSGMKTQ